MSQLESVRGRAGMTCCTDCRKNGKITAVYNSGMRGRKTLYCDDCKKKRRFDSVKRSKARLNSERSV